MIFGKETETLEFKETTGEMKEALIAMSAILNKHGRGELYFGIRIADACAEANVRYGFELRQYGFAIVFFRPETFGEEESDGIKDGTVTGK